MSCTGRVSGTFSFFGLCAIGVAALSALSPARVRADRFDEYALGESFDLPAGADVFDVLGDGRIVVLVDADVYVETGFASREFALLGTLPDVSELQYPAFVRVSPDGGRIAVGDNAFPGSIGVFGVESLAGVWLSASHYDAEWYDDTHLAVSGVDGNAVTLLDTTSPDPSNPTNALIIDDTGFSAGITFDVAGNLYTGNGYGDGPIYTGELRAFDNASWTAALAGGTPLDFIADGTLIVDILSAASIGFDCEGNLHVAGGDFIGDTDLDFAALIRASPVSDALMDLGPADAADPEDVRRMDPDVEDDSNFYSITYSAVAREFYILSFGDTTVYTYSLAPLRGDPWADEVQDAHAALDGHGLYDDPQSALGIPATTFFDSFTLQQFYVSLVAAPFNLDYPDGNKLVTTINAEQFIKVQFDDPVEDHPRNPFGIDLIVFGNSFLVGNGMLTPSTDMEAHYLTPGIFPEYVTVAVSQTGVGNPQTHAEDWYVYDAGPFADSLYPTNAYNWDRDLHDWGAPLDFTTPVDPSLQVADFAGHSVADAIDLYGCSGGGTGYDLSASGFDSIRYVYLTSAGGEVDALSDVFASLGDFDRDGDVDLRDVAGFQNCFHTEQGAELPCECRSADFDGERRIDLADYASLSGYVTGPF